MGELYRRLAAQATPAALSDREVSGRGSTPTSAPSATFCALLGALAAKGVEGIQAAEWQRAADAPWSSLEWIADRMVAMGVADRAVSLRQPKYGTVAKPLHRYTITELGHELVAELVDEGSPGLGPELDTPP